MEDTARVEALVASFEGLGASGSARRCADVVVALENFCAEHQRLPSEHAEDCVQQSLGCWLRRFKSGLRGQGLSAEQTSRLELVLADVQGSSLVRLRSLMMELRRFLESSGGLLPRERCSGERALAGPAPAPITRQFPAGRAIARYARGGGG